MTEAKPFVMISSQSEFDSLCDALQVEKALAIDTEFMRTNTFYAKIGLLQLATASEIYLIDPLSIPDWSGFNRLLLNEGITFVAHSASEDLNLLLTHCGVVPVKLFDTQIAAAFLGFGFSLSYQAIVELLLGIRIEKEETRSDWLKRPLSDKQLHYAADDVLYLLEIADLLTAQLSLKNRLAWFQTECDVAIETAKKVETEACWHTLYSNVSNAWRLSDAGLVLLEKLCFWREQEARKRNKPRSWIAKDADLQTIAVTCAAMAEITPTTLATIKLQDTKLLTRYAAEFSRLLGEIDAEKSALSRAGLNLPLDSAERSILKGLQRVVVAKAEQLEMAPELLGRKKQLVEILQQYQETGELKWPGGQGNWRRPVLEPEFAQILSGGLI